MVLKLTTIRGWTLQNVKIYATFATIPTKHFLIFHAYVSKLIYLKKMFFFSVDILCKSEAIRTPAPYKMY